MTSGLLGVIIDQENYLTGSVNTGGQLIGWEYPTGVISSAYSWAFRRDISEFYDAQEVAGALTVKGLSTSSGLALLRWNDVPMTEEQLDQAEQDGGRILQGVGGGVGHMADSLVDSRYQALIALGKSGHVNDMLMEWLFDNGATTASTLNDRWMEMLASKGFADKQLNDNWYELLGSLGYTGAMNDRELQFWQAGGTFP
jgi:hypothetical protein